MEYLYGVKFLLCSSNPIYERPTKTMPRTVAPHAVRSVSANQPQFNLPSQPRQQESARLIKVTVRRTAVTPVATVEVVASHSVPAAVYIRDDVDLVEAWEIYYNTQDICYRHALFLHYRQWADDAAKKQWHKLPYRPLVDHFDLQQEAYRGLLDAIDHYNPYLGYKFETLAYPRVFGAMIDSLRTLQPFPRIMSALKRDVKRMRDALAQQVGHEPTNQELAEQYGERVWDMLSNPLLDANVYNQGIHTAVNEDDPDVPDLSAALEINSSVGASQSKLDRNDLFDICNEILPHPYNHVITYYYFLDSTLEQIGRYLDKSASTIGKYRKMGIKLLRRNEKFCREFKRLMNLKDAE